MGLGLANAKRDFVPPQNTQKNHTQSWCCRAMWSNKYIQINYIYICFRTGREMADAYEWYYETKFFRVELNYDSQAITNSYYIWNLIMK